MSLENPTYLNDLNESWPVGAVDQVHEGDDHFVRLKAAIKRTFPGMAGRAWRVVNRSANGALTVTDNMTLQNAGGITLTPDAASVLGNGWMCLVRASSGAVTIDPTGNINGAGSMVIPAGYTAMIFSDGGEFFALIVYQDVPPSVKAFPTGTRMVFQQTSAPTGWTKDVSAAYNDATFRSTTGTAATGGADAFSSHFGAGKATSGHALTVSEMPPHSHTVAMQDAFSDDFQTPQSNIIGGGSTSTSTVGGGATHSHVLPNFNIKYCDLIVATIN